MRANGGPLEEMPVVIALARLSLYAVFLGLFGFGILFLVSPGSLTALVDITLPTPVAVMDVRGVYGGFFLGTSLVFLVCARSEAWFRIALVAEALVMGGVVVGRTAGLVVDGPANPFIYGLLVSEIAATVIALIALRRVKRWEH